MPTDQRSLHRFLPRQASETTEFGYEVMAESFSANCLATVRWIECWCPDAARFVLVDAPDDFSEETARMLIGAIGEGPLGRTIRLVCSEETLANDDVLSLLRRNRIDYLLKMNFSSDLYALAPKGIIGVRIDGKTALAAIDSCVEGIDARSLITRAHELGLRAIANQVPSREEASKLHAVGFDYVSSKEEGFSPSVTSFAWQRKVV